MAIKEIVCESCEASFTIEYEMLGRQYLVRFCPFCNEELTEEFTREVEELNDDEPYDIWKQVQQKQKVENLQWMRNLLIEKLEVHPEDIESRSMGAGGEDLIMARAAREKFPLSIECKNQEAVNVWKSYEQASENSGKYEPVVVIKRNKSKPLVVIDAEYFVSLFDK